MDSLLASYASSDEERDEEQTQTKLQKHSTSPQRKSSDSLIFSLPPPKSNLPTSPNPSNFPSFDPKSAKHEGEQRNLQTGQSLSVPTSGFGTAAAKSSAFFASLPEPKISSPFSSLPPPKSNPQSPSNLSSPDPIPKRVVQFKPPINSALAKASVVDDDEEEEEEERRPAKEFVQTPSVKSFLSSIPAPRNSAALGALPSSRSGRRSVLDADVSALDSKSLKEESEGGSSNVGNNDSSGFSGSSGGLASGGDFSSGVAFSENYVNYDRYGGYENYVNYEHNVTSCGTSCGANWSDGSSMMPAPEATGIVDSAMALSRKRGRTEVPTEIVEVKQDELIKNRPREDQTKLTGVAFGPSYQPVSSKGKPSKLHKRKHQIGSLFFDMKQKEAELSERRARGLLTKSETQAKYGW